MLHTAMLIVDTWGHEFDTFNVRFLNDVTIEHGYSEIAITDPLPKLFSLPANIVDNTAYIIAKYGASVRTIH